MTELTLKRGDTLFWECEYTDDIGAAVDLSSYTIKCQARDKDGSLLFSVTTEDGTIDAYSPAEGFFKIMIGNTGQFKVGDYKVDIEYTIGTLVRSSDTFLLKVIQDITR